MGYAADPSECIKAIRNLSGVVIAGNHDWAAAGKLSLERLNHLACDAIRWTAGVLSGEEKDFLGALPLVHKEEDFVLVHGSLYNPHDFDYLNNPKSAASTFAILEKQVCFIGHTHRPGVFIEDIDYNRIFYKGFISLHLEEHKKYIVNVGSVGQPRDGNPRASFVVYDTQAKTIELKRIPYNLTVTQEKIIKSGLPFLLASRLGEGN